MFTILFTVLLKRDSLDAFYSQFMPIGELYGFIYGIYFLIQSVTPYSTVVSRRTTRLARPTAPCNCAVGVAHGVGVKN